MNSYYKNLTYEKNFGISFKFAIFGIPPPHIQKAQWGLLVFIDKTFYCFLISQKESWKLDLIRYSVAISDPFTRYQTAGYQLACLLPI